MQMSTPERPSGPPAPAGGPPPPPAEPSADVPVTLPSPSPTPPLPAAVASSSSSSSAPRDPRETLALLTGLLQEHDRLLSSRDELAAKLVDVDEQLQAVAARIDGVHSLLRPDVA